MLAGAAGGIAVTTAAVDGRATVVGDLAAFPVADLGPGVGFAVAFLGGVLAATLGPLVGLLALLAPVLGGGLSVAGQEGGETAQQGQAGEEAEQAAAGAGLAQGAGESIEA